MENNIDEHSQPTMVYSVARSYLIQTGNEQMSLQFIHPSGH